MELFELEISPCFIIFIYALVIGITFFRTRTLIMENDNDEPFDEEKYIELRAEKEQFKVMWVSLSVLGVLVDQFPPLARLLGALVAIWLFARYYRRLEEFSTRQEMKKEELKLKKGNE